MAKQANAEVKFMQEQELKKHEEHAYDCQIKMLCLQIQYQHTMHASRTNAPAAGSSSTAGPGHPS